MLPHTAGFINRLLYDALGARGEPRGLVPHAIPHAPCVLLDRASHLERLDADVPKDTSRNSSLLGNQPYRKDIRLNATIFGEYRFRPWLALFGDFGYLADFTDFEYTGTGALLAPAARYQRFEAWLGIRVFY